MHYCTHVYTCVSVCVWLYICIDERFKVQPPCWLLALFPVTTPLRAPIIHGWRERVTYFGLGTSLLARPLRAADVYVLPIYTYMLCIGACDLNPRVSGPYGLRVGFVCKA